MAVSSDRLTWMEQGVCRTENIDVEVFFPKDKSPGERLKARRAKRACARCPVQVTCREYALATGQSGIWGNTTDYQRDQIRDALLGRSA